MSKEIFRKFDACILVIDHMIRSISCDDVYLNTRFYSISPRPYTTPNAAMRASQQKVKDRGGGGGAKFPASLVDG